MAKKSWLESALFRLCLSSSLFMLGAQVVGIFIPIFLLTHGMALENVLATYLFTWGTMMLAPLVAGEMTERLGVEVTLGLRAPLYSLFLLFLLFPGEGGWSPATLGFLYGLPLALYWTSQKIFLSSHIHPSRAGLETSIVFALPFFTGIVAPVLGGYAISSFGYDIALWASLFLSLIAVVPLLKGKRTKTGAEAVPGDREIGEDFPYLVRFFLQGVYNVGGTLVWPIFVWQAVGDVTVIGLMTAIASVAQALFTVGMGELSDLYETSIIIRLGALLNGAVFLAMPSASTPLQTFAIGTAWGFARAMTEPLVFADFSRHIVPFGKVSHNVLRQMTINLGRVLFTAFCISFFDFKTVFEASAAAAFLVALV